MSGTIETWADQRAPKKAGFGPTWANASDMHAKYAYCAGKVQLEKSAMHEPEMTPMAAE
jgi:hypothetical protein